MESRFVKFSALGSPSVSALPFCLSYKSSPLRIPKFGSEKESFLGQVLGFDEKNVPLGNFRKAPFSIHCIKTGIVKRRKEIPFDNLIQRDKNVKLVLKIRKILMDQPQGIMSLRELGRFRKDLGLQKPRRIITVLRKFPAVFQIVDEGAYSLQFKLTPEAESLYLEEKNARNGTEELWVVKLRKLLMMSIHKRILVEKIANLGTDLGLPLQFCDAVCDHYPQYFKVVATGRGPALELTHWDPELAVSALEIAVRNEEWQREEGSSIPRIDKVKLPKGLNLSRSEMRRISPFREMPYISPYSSFSKLKSGSVEKEKHACGVVHEILSLTVEKRTPVDHLAHFREDFRLSQQFKGMLMRHPDMFYVSLKGSKDSVFLREAYRNSQLIEKDELFLIKERLCALVKVPRVRGRDVLSTNPDEGQGLERVEEDEFYHDGNLTDDNEDSEDDCSDDHMLPVVSEKQDSALPDSELRESVKPLNGSRKFNAKILVPVPIDCPLRELW